MTTRSPTLLSLLLLAGPALAQDTPEEEPPDDLALTTPEGALEDLLGDEPDEDLGLMDLLGGESSDPWEPAPAATDEAEPLELAQDSGLDVGALIRDSRLGGRLGLGAPARGTTATVYLGAQWRVPDVVPDVLDLQADLGWYFIGTHEELAQQDPFGGSQLVEVDFTTHVIPLELSGLLRPPIDMSFMPVPTKIFGGLGVHTSLVIRQDEERAAGLTVGTQLFVGADLSEVGPGVLSPTLSWMGARRALGRVSADGEPTRETVANLRLNFAYTLPF